MIEVSKFRSKDVVDDQQTTTNNKHKLDAKKRHKQSEAHLCVDVIVGGEVRKRECCGLDGFAQTTLRLEIVN